MARSPKSPTPPTLSPVQIPEPVALQGRWPAAAYAALGAALNFALQSCHNVLELQDIHKPVASHMTLHRFNLSTQSQYWKHTSLAHYQDQQFDAIFAVDLADLVSKPQNLVPDLYRVLTNEKLFISIKTRKVPTDSSNHMAVGWETILKRNQVASAFKLGKPPSEALDEALLANGASLKKIDRSETRLEVCRWLEPFSPRHQFDFITSQGYKAPIPAEIYSRCIIDYERWLKAQYSDLDTPMEAYFEIVMRVWHW
jgi:hypothetical protein